MFEALELPEQNKLGRGFLEAFNTSWKEAGLTPIDAKVLLGGSRVWQEINRSVHHTDILPDTDSDFYIQVPPGVNLNEIGDRILAKYPGATLIAGGQHGFYQFTYEGNDYSLSTEPLEVYLNFQTRGVEVGKPYKIHYDPHFPGHAQAMHEYIVHHKVIVNHLLGLISGYYFHLNNNDTLNAGLKINKLAFIIKALKKPLEIGKTFSYETALMFDHLIKNHPDLWTKVKTRVFSYFELQKEKIKDTDSHINKLESVLADSINVAPGVESALRVKLEAHIKELTDLEAKYRANIVKHEAELGKKERLIYKKDEEIKELNEAAKQREKATQKLAEENNALRRSNADKAKELKDISAELRVASEKYAEKERKAEIQLDERGKTIATAHDKISQLEAENKKLTLQEKDYIDDNQTRYKLVVYLSFWLINTKADLDYESFSAKELSPFESTKASMAAAALPRPLSNAGAQVYVKFFKANMKVISTDIDIRDLSSLADVLFKLDKLYQEYTGRSKKPSMINRIDGVSTVLQQIRLMLESAFFKQVISSDKNKKSFEMLESLHGFFGTIMHSDESYQNHMAKLFSLFESMNENVNLYKYILERWMASKFIYDGSTQKFYQFYRSMGEHLPHMREKLIQSVAGANLKLLDSLVEKCASSQADLDVYNIWYTHADVYLKKEAENKNKKGKGKNLDELARESLKSIFKGYIAYYKSIGYKGSIELHLSHCRIYSDPPYNNPKLPWNHPFYTGLSVLLDPTFVDKLPVAESDKAAVSVITKIIEALDELRKYNILSLPEENLSDDNYLLDVLLAITNPKREAITVSEKIHKNLEFIHKQVEKRISPIQCDEQNTDASTKIKFVLCLRHLLQGLTTPISSSPLKIIRTGRPSEYDIKEITQVLSSYQVTDEMSVANHAIFIEELLRSFIALGPGPYDDKIIMNTTIQGLVWMDTYLSVGDYLGSSKDLVFAFYAKLFLLTDAIEVSYISKNIDPDLYLCVHNVLKRLITGADEKINGEMIWNMVHIHERMLRLGMVYVKHENTVISEKPTQAEIDLFCKDFHDAVIYCNLHNEVGLGLSINFVAARSKVIKDINVASSFLEKIPEGKIFGENIGPICCRILNGIFYEYFEIQNGADELSHESQNAVLTRINKIFTSLRSINSSKRPIEYLMSLICFCDELMNTKQHQKSHIIELKCNAFIEYLFSMNSLKTMNSGQIDSIINEAMAKFKSRNPLALTSDELDDCKTVLTLIHVLLDHYRFHMVDITVNRDIYDAITLISARILFRKDNIVPQSTAVAVQPVDTKSLESLADKLPVFFILLIDAMQSSDQSLKVCQNFPKKYFKYAMSLYSDNLTSTENVQEILKKQIQQFYVGFSRLHPLERETYAPFSRVLSIMLFSANIKKYMNVVAQNEMMSHIDHEIEFTINYMIKEKLFSLPEPYASDRSLHLVSLYHIFKGYQSNHIPDDKKTTPENHFIARCADRIAEKITEEMQLKAKVLNLT